MSVRELYDRCAPDYEAMVARTGYIGSAWLDQQLQALSGSLENVTSAVDLGCASGSLGRVLRERFPGAVIEGVDISPKMTALARDCGCYDSVRTADLGEPLTFVPDGRYALAVALGVAEFLREPGVLVREVARILRPGGWLLISFQEHWPERPSEAPRQTRSGDVPHYAWSLDEARAILEEDGFELVRVESRTGYVSGRGFSCPYVFSVARANPSGRPER